MIWIFSATYLFLRAQVAALTGALDFIIAKLWWWTAFLCLPSDDTLHRSRVCQFTTTPPGYCAYCAVICMCHPPCQCCVFEVLCACVIYNGAWQICACAYWTDSATVAGKVANGIMQHAEYAAAFCCKPQPQAGCHPNPYGYGKNTIGTIIKAPTTPLDLSILIGLSVFQLNLN